MDTCPRAGGRFPKAGCWTTAFLCFILLIPLVLWLALSEPVPVHAQVTTEPPRSMSATYLDAGVAVAPSPGGPGSETFGKGFVPPDMDLSYLDLSAPAVRTAYTDTLPSSFDWRDRDGVSYVTEPRWQGNCGACYAFAGLGNVESRETIDGGAWLPDYSEKNIRDCNWYALSGTSSWDPCSGGNYMMAANYLSKKGTVLESVAPYTETVGTCPASLPYETTLLGWSLFSTGTPAPTDTLKQAIMTHGPLYSSIYAGDTYNRGWETTFHGYDGSGVLIYAGLPVTTNHAVLIVGWDDAMVHDNGTGAWIAKNSWGSDWGDAGYFYMAYGPDDGYGAAGLGSWAATMTDWQPYDALGELLYYDEGGWTGYSGYGNSTSAWGLNVFTPTQKTTLTRVEFWTPDVMQDVDIYLYDDFADGPVGDPLWQSLGHHYATPGYYSVPVTECVGLEPGDDVVAVVKFDAQSSTEPVPLDREGDVDGNSWISPDGISWAPSSLDIGIRVRVSTSPADVSIVKEVQGADFRPGDPITFTLTLANTGSGVASGVIVTDVMPSQVLNRSVTSTLLITRTGPVDYVWDVAPLASGEGGVITITGELASTYLEGEVFENVAIISDPQDATLDDNVSRVEIGYHQVFLPLLLRNYPLLQRRTLTAVADTSVVADYPGTNAGDDPAIHVGYGGDWCNTWPGVSDGGVTRALVRFDLSSIPVDAVRSATLVLARRGCCSYVDGSDPVLRVYRIAEGWDENTVTWRDAPDFGGAYGSVQLRNGAGAPMTFEVDVTGLVNLWLRGTVNHGMMLRSYEGDGLDAALYSFGSREGAATYEPRLEIEYYGQAQ